MKFQLKKEIPLWIILVLPIIYLVISWGSIPESVPLHFNMHGKPDRWGSKWELAGLVALLPLFLYLLLLFVPKIDPKKRLLEMGNKYYGIRLASLLVIAGINVFLLYSLNHEVYEFGRYSYVLIGGTFALMGNYFRNLKPNYFIGFRTPWALENETNWKRTHRMGSRLWFFSGIVLILLNFIDSLHPAVRIFSIGLIALCITAPIVYSYSEFRKLKSDKPVS